MSRGAVVLLLLAAACESERPPMREAPAAGSQRAAPQTSDFQAGPARPVAYVESPYEGNPRAIAEGQRLYTWMNCGGCHGGQGGGGIGPPFADGDWIYGGDPANVFQSIVQGRPNGMPAYGGRLANTELWKIVAYVRTLGEGPDASSRPAGVPVDGDGGDAEGTGGGGGQAGEREANVPGGAP